jgi:hypothetical protein
MEAVGSSETLVITYDTTGRRKPEDKNPDTRCCQMFQSQNFFLQPETNTLFLAK